jgi:hypothetical protein
MWTLQFGTYTFPNKTFEVDGHQLSMDTPVGEIRRADRGKSLDGYIRPKKFRIRGKVYGDNADSVHNSINIMKRALHNSGLEAELYYRSDRYVNCRLAVEGINGVWEKGLYEYLMNVDAVFVAARPWAESTSLRTVTGTRTNNSAVDNGVVNNGHFPTEPLFTFVAGTWAFSNDLRVDNNGNSHWFSYGGPFVAGQTLVIDCALGCVLLQVGLTMVDAISYFAGHLFFKVEEGGTNPLVINGATLAYTIQTRDRWYL